MILYNNTQSIVPKGSFTRILNMDSTLPPTPFQKKLFATLLLLALASIPLVNTFGTSPSMVTTTWAYLTFAVLTLLVSKRLQDWFEPRINLLHSLLLRSETVVKTESFFGKWDGVFWPTPIAACFVTMFMGPPMGGFMEVVSLMGVFSIMCLTPIVTIAAFRATLTGRLFWSTLKDQKNLQKA